MYLLQRNCGIYRRSDADVRIYDLRCMILDHSPNAPTCVLKSLVRLFILECTEYYLLTKSRDVVHETNHRNYVFEFIKNVRRQMDSRVLGMLESEQKCIQKEEKEYLTRMDQFLITKRIRIK